jgi:succinylglutamate desuccinylase
MGDPGSGPTLICIGSLHGNEPAGWLGLSRVIESLRSDEVEVRGEMIALAGNRGALARGERWVDVDLNRLWIAERLDALEQGSAPDNHEETELVELVTEMRAAIERSTQPVWLLDLHTTSGEGPPFGVLDDTLPNREFAEIFGIPFVVGLEEELDGTVLSYFVSRGLRTFGLECGQHDDPASADRAEAAIWLALVGIGLVPETAAPDLAACRELLCRETHGLPGTVEIRYRHAVAEADGFQMDEGWQSFHRIESGTRLATDRAGVVKAPEKGRLLMPLYQRQGNDGFFVVREVRPLWLRMSATLRRMRAERFLHWLPGVRRAEGETDGFLVNRHVARWFALEILHLLGFRRHGDAGSHVVVSRRPDNR